MRRISLLGSFVPALVPIALLAACSSGQSEQKAAEATANPTTATTDTPAPSAAPSPAAAPACAPPALVPESGQKWPAGLVEGGSDLQKLRDAFGAGFAQLCSQKIIQSAGIKTKSGKLIDRIVLRNAPEANVASLYEDEETKAVVLEAPMFGEGERAVTIPSSKDLKETIYCFVKGPTAEEAETQSRCSPD